MITRKTFVFLLLSLAACGLALFGCGGHGVDQVITSTSTPSSSSSSSSGSLSSSSSSTSSTLSPTATYSISGAIKFAGTSDPVMGGVYLNLKNNSGTVVSSSVANSNTGVFSFNGIHTGSYTLEATKEGWAISSEALYITTANISTDFSLIPAQWDILHVGGGISFTGIASYEGPFSPDFYGKMFVSCNDGAILQSSAPYTNWAHFPSPAFNPLISILDSFHESFAIFAIDNHGYAYGISNEATGWINWAQGTSETFKAAAENYDPQKLFMISASTGKLINTTNTTDITPTNEAGIVLNNVFSSFTNTATTTLEVVGENGKAFICSDAFASSLLLWQPINLGTADDLTACAMLPDGTGLDIIGTANGAIFTSFDLTNWTQEISGIPYAIKNAYTTLSGEAFVCGENGLIMRRK